MPDVWEARTIGFAVKRVRNGVAFVATLRLPADGFESEQLAERYRSMMNSIISQV